VVSITPNPFNGFFTFRHLNQSSDGFPVVAAAAPCKAVSEAKSPSIPNPPSIFPGPTACEINEVTEITEHKNSAIFVEALFFFIAIFIGATKLNPGQKNNHDLHCKAGA
jgi:hypothetical protein